MPVVPVEKDEMPRWDPEAGNAVIARRRAVATPHAAIALGRPATAGAVTVMPALVTDSAVRLGVVTVGANPAIPNVTAQPSLRPRVRGETRSEPFVLASNVQNLHSPPKQRGCAPGNKNRRAALAEMPEVQHGLAEEVLKGGVPGVRKAIARMNKMAEADGIPKVKSEPLVALAEKMTPVLKSAEWRDRAEAAISGIETVDLRDIRSVVVAADSGARDEQSRELAEKLREGLTARVESEHRLWA